MTPHRRRAARLQILGFLLAVGVLPGPGEQAAAQEMRQAGTLSLILENDLFYNLDRHYTNGVQAIWTTAPDATPGWAGDLAGLVPFFPRDGEVRTAWKLGQNMYTPQDITVAVPAAGTRPYAGWLYGAVGVLAENGRELHQFQVTLGVVGPWALAEQAQKLVHDITGAAEPQGWDTQLENEPGLVLAYQRSWRAFVAEEMLGFGFDVTPHAGFALGNVYTYLDAGATLRLGRHLPNDYGPPRIQPSLPGSGFFSPAEGHDFGWYLFAGLSGRAVARNIFLDGNSFRDSRSVDRNVWTGDLQLGLALTLHGVRLTYTHVFRSKEFQEQEEGDEFGAVALSWKF